MIAFKATFIVDHAVHLYILLACVNFKVFESSRGSGGGADEQSMHICGGNAPIVWRPRKCILGYGHRRSADARREETQHGPVL